MATPLWSGNWAIDVIGGTWDTRIDSSGPARIESVALRAPERGISYSRGCILTVPGKFFAETLLVYPAEGRDFPIFGSEYIEMTNRYFGATDFHPPNRKNDLVDAIFSGFPDRIVQSSRHYDLDGYFSTKLWHKRDKKPFYDEFKDICTSRLRYYMDNLQSVTQETKNFSDFDAYMAENDPAHGILKSYFGSDFANDYIKEYLFPHASCN